VQTIDQNHVIRQIQPDISDSSYSAKLIVLYFTDFT
jgi:hypothetical protein